MAAQEHGESGKDEFYSQIYSFVKDHPGTVQRSHVATNELPAGAIGARTLSPEDQKSVEGYSGFGFVIPNETLIRVTNSPDNAIFVLLSEKTDDDEDLGYDFQAKVAPNGQIEANVTNDEEMAYKEFLKDERRQKFVDLVLKWME